MGKENTSSDENEIIGKIRRIRGDSSKLEQPSGCGQLGTVTSCYLAQELEFLGLLSDRVLRATERLLWLLPGPESDAQVRSRKFTAAD